MDNKLYGTDEYNIAGFDTHTILSRITSLLVWVIYIN